MWWWISWLVDDVVGPNRLDEALRTLSDTEIRAYSVIDFSGSIHCRALCFMSVVLILVGIAVCSIPFAFSVSRLCFGI